METLNKMDLQGILVRSYKELPAACFLLLKIKSSEAAKSWMTQNIHLFTSGDMKPTDFALNIAFTIDGLKELGLEEGILGSFPYEFQDGMISPHKQSLLGDFGKSDPDYWHWGGRRNEKIHAVLMLYSSNNAVLNNYYSKIKSGWEQGPFEEIRKLDTKEITERKEHFGFHDGIAQPTIKGIKDKGDRPQNVVADGEFILGYRNEYGQFTASPSVPASSDSKNLLPAVGSNSSEKDLGTNGTYLVIRQLKQDVQEFWDFMEVKTRNNDGTCNPGDMIGLASKVVGRWPSGTPMVLSPDKDNPDEEDKNDFKYIPSDVHGMKCPFGAHVRRTNPRDSINRGDSTSVTVSNKHRILRRGRSYGTPVAESMKPEDIIKSNDRSGERGLYFICLNADLSRQFEFIQNFWINNPKFDGLYDERDPLIGNHSNPMEQKTTGTFGIPKCEIRERFTDLPEFVTVKGGSYFFLPGINALKYISSL